MVSSVDFCFDKISKRKDNRFGYVVCRVRSGRNVKRLPLGVSITEDDWLSFSSYYQNTNTDGSDKGSPKEDGVTKRGKSIVSTLGITNERFAYILDDIRRRLFEDDITCTDAIVPLIISTRIAIHLNDRFLSIEGESRKSLKKISLAKFMEDYANDKESGKRLKEGSLAKVTPRYIRRLRMIATNIRSFERFRGERIFLEDVTMPLRDEYLDWCRGKGLSTNTIVQRIEAIHCVMRIAFEEGYTENSIHANSGFVPLPEKVGSVLISHSQIQKLMELDLSSEEKVNELLANCKIGKRRMERYSPLLTPDKIILLGQARDIFIIGCLTGQRYSDYSRLRPDMITEMNDMSFIGVVQQKTKKRVVIPLDARVEEILFRYKDGLPNMPVALLNECLHLIGELLHWTWKPVFSGNAPHSHIGIRYCDLLTSHTARRSFATNAYASRVPVESIMAVTGHSSELRLRDYVRNAPEASASIVATDFEKFLEL